MKLRSKDELAVALNTLSLSIGIMAGERDGDREIDAAVYAQVAILLVALREFADRTSGFMREGEHPICPNGHEVGRVIAVPCEECAALVTYEPMAAGRRMHRMLERNERLVRLFEEHGSPDLTRMVRNEADRLDTLGGLGG
jgi:hypothetical protein